MEVTGGFLRSWPLPEPDPAADKEARGRVLVVGGSAEVPGAVLLTGVAALRVGAGKLQIATAGSVAGALGVALPEARVIGLPEAADGSVAAAAAGTVQAYAARARVVVIGPGMGDPPAVRAIVEAAVRSDGDPPPVVVLDAAAIGCMAGEDAAALLRPLAGRLVLTPNPSEVATLLDRPTEEVAARPGEFARQVASELSAVVAVKGDVTCTAAPDGRTFEDAAGNVGLATSGSGDVAAGAVAGLAARGADPLQATVWGIHLHAAAGDRLAARVGPLGYLARELAEEFPGLLRELSR